MALHTLIITNSEKFPAHTNFANILLQKLNLLGVEGQVYTITATKPLHQHFYSITNTNADFYITLDLAGFEMKTDGGRIGYNLISSRMAHLLLLPLGNYSPEILSSPMNFSMFFFTTSQEEISLYNTKYPDLPHILHTSLISILSDNSASINTEFLTQLLQLLELAK